MGPALQKLCRQAVRRGGVLPRPPFTENTTVNRVGGQGRPPLQPFNVLVAPSVAGHIGPALQKYHRKAPPLEIKRGCSYFSRFLSIV